VTKNEAQDNKAQDSRVSPNRFTAADVFSSGSCSGRYNGNKYDVE
jgi:hypothetical protein